MKSKGRINNVIAHRLRDFRLAKKMTSQEVARRAGISPASYSCLENGWYKINIDNLFKILQVLKADITDIWPRSDDNGADVIDDEYMEKAAQSAIQNQPRPITLDDVFDAVADSFEITRKVLLSPSRRWKRLSEARGVCGILVEDIQDLDLNSMSRYLGYSTSRMRQLVDEHQERVFEDENLASRLEDARQRIKQKFRNLDF